MYYSLNMNENNIKYKTTNLNLTTFLVVKDFRLLAIENNSKRKTFVFDNSSELVNIVQIFNFGEDNNPELMVDARKLFRTSKEIKTKLYSI